VRYSNVSKTLFLSLSEVPNIDIYPIMEEGKKSSLRGSGVSSVEGLVTSDHLLSSATKKIPALLYLIIKEAPRAASNAFYGEDGLKIGDVGIN